MASYDDYISHAMYLNYKKKYNSLLICKAILHRFKYPCFNRENSFKKNIMITRKFIPLFITLFISLFFIPSGVAKQNDQENVLRNFEELIASHKGKIVYLDFWASWCGPCRKSFPWLNKMQEKYQQQGLVIISVNVDNDRALANEFLTKVPAQFNVFYDPKGKVARKFKLKGMPSSYIIDRSGKLASNHVGFSASKKMKYEQEIVALLNISD